MTEPRIESPQHRIVSRREWLLERQRLLAQEKELTRRSDELARQRLTLPWVRVEKEYRFAGPAGPLGLGELFAGRDQLLVYHFMFGPDWQEGCPSCSFGSDHMNAALPHLDARGVRLALVSRAPLAKIEPFKARMGWSFPWVSSSTSDFNFDFQVSFTEQQIETGAASYNFAPLPRDFPMRELPGLSAFYREPASGEIFHTYSTYGRGSEGILTAYVLLDLAPKGRDEGALPFPMAWVRHHDRYGTSLADGFADPDKPYWPKVAGL